MRLPEPITDAKIWVYKGTSEWVSGLQITDNLIVTLQSETDWVTPLCTERLVPVVVNSKWSSSTVTGPDLLTKPGLDYSD